VVHYSRCRRERFLARSQKVAAMGFDQTFMRTWEYHLAYSEAGFRAQYIDVTVLELRK
jgi:cyclopropane-fatty-acyl-phospholipid synthase